MQITNSASGMPYMAATETDYQNRLQDRQRTLQQTEEAVQISASYKVSLSAEAKALNSRQIQADTATAAARNTTQVNPGLATQDTTRNEQSTSPRLQVAQNPPPAAQSAPAAPAGQATEMNNDQAAARDTARRAASPPSEDTSASTQPDTTTGGSTSPSTSPVAQPVAPQTRNTPQKPAQEPPMAAAGGMSPGNYTIDLSV